MDEMQQYYEDAQPVVQKWAKVLESVNAEPIRDPVRRTETAKMLEQQAQANANAAMRDRAMSGGYALLNEDASANNTGNVQIFDPVLIGMVRRSAPLLMSYEFAGVQTMNQPTGLVFSMYSRYTDKNGAEALFNEADTSFTGRKPVAGERGVPGGATGGDINTAIAATDPFAALYSTGVGMNTADAEGDIGPTMAFTIDKIGVTAVERQLRGSYSIELAQDLNAVHKLDAAVLLSGVLSRELLAEQNREFVRTLYIVGKLGAENTGTPGTFNIDSDADGRWQVEKYKTLLTQIGFEANKIWLETRRGLGNKIIASPNVVTALYMTGMLDTGGPTSLNREMNPVDMATNTYVGRLLGQYDVHIDPYLGTDAILIGYRGAEAWDAGIYWCPYIPLTKYTATDPKSMHPVMAYKTRYGVVSNPYVKKIDNSADGMSLTPLRNQYFRKFRVNGIG